MALMREQPRLLSTLSAGYHIFIFDGEIFSSGLPYLSKQSLLNANSSTIK